MEQSDPYVPFLLRQATPKNIACLQFPGFNGSQLGTFCPQAIVYCYHEFKLHFTKNLELFSIRVKELFEPIVLQKMVMGFCSLKAFS